MFRTLLITLFATVTFAPRAALADDTSALLARSRAALGGDAILSLSSLHVVSELQMLGLHGTQEQWLDLAGGRFAESNDAGPASGGDGFDGHDPWVRDASGIVHVEGSVEARLQGVDQAYLNGFALWMPDRGGATVRGAGTKTEGGSAYDVLVVTPPGGTPMDVWFDRRTALPWRTVVTIGRHTFTSTLDDYRRVSGALVPFHVLGASDDGNSQETRIARVEPNPPGLAARVVRPASDVHDFTIEGGATSTAVPFQLIDNHVYVDVRLNGKGPFRFVFDSGGANVIDPGVLRQLGASAQGSAQGSGVGSQTESISFTTVDSLQIGGAKLTHAQFAVLPIGAGFGIASGSPIDGIIGFEVLARYVTTFDYGANRVVLRLPGDTAADAFGARIPFVFHDNTPMISGSLDGVPAQMTVDTGSRMSVSVFKPFAAAHPEVLPAALTAAGVNGFGIGGPALGRLGRLDTLQIGPFLLRETIADFSTQEKGSFADPYTAANVGGGVWKRFALTFDYPHQTLYLTPNAALSEGETYDRSGAFVIERAGAPVILAVRAGTPAEAAGLRKGDTIESVDGHPAATLSLADVRAALRADAGTHVRLGISRGGTSQDIDVTLRDYV